MYWNNHFFYCVFDYRFKCTFLTSVFLWVYLKNLHSSKNVEGAKQFHTTSSAVMCYTAPFSETMASRGHTINPFSCHGCRLQGKGRGSIMEFWLRQSTLLANESTILLNTTCFACFGKGCIETIFSVVDIPTVLPPCLQGYTVSQFGILMVNISHNKVQ